MSRGQAWLLWSAVWIVNALLAGAMPSVLRQHWFGPRVSMLVALLPALPIAVGLILFLFILRRMDEFRRMLTISAFALSSAIVGIIVYGWSLLGFVGVGGLLTVWILPAQLALWSALMVAARLRFP